MDKQVAVSTRDLSFLQNFSMCHPGPPMVRPARFSSCGRGLVELWGSVFLAYGFRVWIRPSFTWMLLPRFEVGDGEWNYFTIQAAN